MHLRLPKMRRLLPSRVLCELDQHFDIAADEILTDIGHRPHREKAKRQKFVQRTLFDDLNDDTETDNEVASTPPAEWDVAATNASTPKASPPEKPKRGGTNITPGQIGRIRSLRKQGFKIKKIAELVGVTTQTVHRYLEK